MGWVRVSDDFYDHGAHAPLQLAEWGLWLWSLAWANRNLTDGVVPKAVVKRMDPDGLASAALIDAGRWHDKDDEVVIHDYLEFQPSKEQITAKREKERERWQRRADSTPTPPPLRADSAATPPASQPQPQDTPNGVYPKQKRGKTAIPEEFEVTDAMADWVTSKYSELDWNRQTEKFVAWAKANDRRYADWVQAWRNWMHNSVEGKFR